MEPVYPSAEFDLLAYRVDSIKVGRVALHHMANWEDAAPPLRVYFGDKLVIDGSPYGFTNTAIEIAVIHSRAIMDFLGIKAESADRLRQISARERKGGDAGIEGIPGLRMPSVAEVINGHEVPPDQVQTALSYVLYMANKGLAHMTSGFIPKDGDHVNADIAFRVIPGLVWRCVFDPLGIAPKQRVTARPREDAISTSNVAGGERPPVT